MADKVVLLSSWASVFGLRVQIALAEKGVDYEFREEDLFDKSPLLLESNPVHKKVPVLIHNGKPICESSIIIQYIDEVWTKGPSLLPKDPLQRANARFWADFINQTIYPCSSRIWRNKGDVQSAAKKELIGILKQLEGELGERPFFGGETLGYVDIVLVPFSRWFYTYETFGGFSIEKECPKLMAWVRRCNEKESVSKVLPDPHKVYERNCGLKKRLGLE
ncbi:glutathione S-transferase 3-like [Elaeis guineensis]|uniref:Probable glutathione S-transferase GSTU1 n=1 Tax=Elaeis guineensis var. tenera TaxID=51953 RepID=A0A6I9SBK4_ELAGV|nr:glutathione S-transferase 3-like [Elaeis guineensis]